MARSLKDEEASQMCENHTEKAAVASCQKHSIGLCLGCLLNKYHVDCDITEMTECYEHRNDYIRSIIQLTQDIQKAKDNTENHLKHINDTDIQSLANIQEIKYRLIEKTNTLAANSQESVKTIIKGKTDDVLCCMAKLQTVENKLQALVDHLNETDNAATGLHRQVSSNIQEIQEEMPTQDFSQLESKMKLDLTFQLRKEVQLYSDLDSNDKRGYFFEPKGNDIPPPVINHSCDFSSDMAGSKDAYDSLFLETKDDHVYERSKTQLNEDHVSLKQHGDGGSPCKLTKLVAFNTFLVVCDVSHDYVHLYKVCGTYMNGIKFESSRSIKDICAMTGDNLAVACQHQPMVTTLRLLQENLEVEKHITVTGHIRTFQSLGYDTQMNLFVFCSYKDVFIVNSTGDIIHSVSFSTGPKRLMISGLSRRGPRPSLSVSKHAVYDFSTRSVYICDSILETLQKHSLDRKKVVWKQTDGLHRPRFVLLLGEKIYVACENEITVLASDTGEILYISVCKGENISLAVLEKDSPILVTANSDDCKVSRMIKFVKR